MAETRTSRRWRDRWRHKRTQPSTRGESGPCLIRAVKIRCRPTENCFQIRSDRFEPPQPPIPLHAWYGYCVLKPGHEWWKFRPALRNPVNKRTAHQTPAPSLLCSNGLPWKHLTVLYLLAGSAFITALVAASKAGSSSAKGKRSAAQQGSGFLSVAMLTTPFSRPGSRARAGNLSLRRSDLWGVWCVCRLHVMCRV